MTGDDRVEVWTVVVAAGSGTRFGGPKQHEALGGSTVLERSVAVARTVSDGVVVVEPASAAPRTTELAPLADAGADAVVAGGDTRSRSVSNGLAAVPDTATVILVHDAARPLASRELFERVLAGVLAGADGVVPVVTVLDTIRDLDGTPVDRDRLRAVQTPQGFRASALRAAHATGAGATDDASLVSADGGRVVLVEGERTNLKITEPTDIVVARALVEHLEQDERDAARSGAFDRGGRRGGDSPS